MTPHQEVEKSNIFIKIDHFDLPPFHQQLEKSKTLKIQIYSVTSINLTYQQEVEKLKNSKYLVKCISLTSQQEVKKSKKYNIFSKIDHFELPSRGRKEEKSKKIQ